MDWVEVILPAGELADEVAALLASTDAVASAGVEVRGGDVVAWAPAVEAAAAAAAMRAAAARLREAGLPVDPAAVRTAAAPPEAEWRDAWKRTFRTTRIGRRLVIVPSWDRFEPGPGDLVLDLDPGRAFGTGAHASTRLCLVELERLADEDGLAAGGVLDVGTGSGILAIAAARLWPGARLAAVDVDPEAIEVARENAERNRVGDRIALDTTPVGEVPGTWEVVVANIQADVLLPLRDGIAARVAPGGALVLSGLLADQAGPVAAEYEAAGLVTARIATLDDDRDWSAVVLRRPR
jgi:ribosomal protein L11 methyltransferase